ncbi:aspartate 1-decarboxylase [Pyrobaculum islandicum DSM 4184]|uniref:Aspartate 1-decarboxylase n=1 Tax=Pyrobaculum islandicum (strain DSM 4184 / JCM 9189 / GEO3) TaxID=384616 RepID=PAND_PYRIL|nr:aspartate 1-decarboxylase [Pyrobaculum islandicum]A1RUA9.1 RecName: Full=Aspartate 1-decarboxylase; AltName: Full=Aspartate alpha-decarboxylase; Contains: RecName: Full=Aspartate 1-decarboxylase beta chain; Contains: RecName: Full=Aspartate 1-decarboxylase alpha chain; Flags: Precursor [Pyrobaculum islandicum DSM 4184]ABL88541.1 aspartate 1-decarboxylase [Pyrobaculum islandicum DSM 4184]
MPVLLRAKAHGLVVTGKNLHYEGSLTLGRDIIEAAGFYPLEKVEVYNVTNGARFTTYVIPGRPGEVVLNGAAARLGEVGDVIIVAAYECVANPASHIATIAIFEGNKLKEVRKISLSDMY